MTRENGWPKAVFFDLDDTLYDQLEPFRAALEAFGGAVGGIAADELYRRFRRHSEALWEPYRAGRMTLERMRVERIRRALADCGIEAEEADCERFQAMYQEGQYRIRLRPGAEFCLAELASAGFLLGVVTNGPGPHQARKLEALGIGRYIPRERWFISGEIGAAKPDPALFAHVNRATGTRPERCALVGDSPENDVGGAARAGWRAVWFNPREGASHGGAPDGDASHGCAAGPLPEADLMAGDFRDLARRLIGLMA